MKPRILQTRRISKLALIIGSVLAVVIPEYLSFRNKAMDRLYAEAAGYPQYFRDTEGSKAAIKKLAAYHDRRATTMLLQIALSHGSFIPGIQTEAIRALGDRENPEISVSLANLLQPHEGLDTRQAVAEALQELPCKGECTRSILHYLERVWRGEPNYEDRTMRPPGFEDVKTSLQKEQQTLYATLYLVLQRNKVETVTALAQVYGLGSDGPSTFALDLVSRLGLHEACPSLLQSDKIIKERPPESFKEPRQELEAALASLNCR